MQANGLEHQRVANSGLLEIAKKMDIPLAGTNDCHYLKKEDFRPHELMLCLQTGKTISDPNRMKFDTDQLYVKSTEEVSAAFIEFPDAVANTCRIADNCDLQLALNKTHLPQYKVPEGFTTRILSGTTGDWRDCGPAQNGPARSCRPPMSCRLHEELTIICSMGFAGYFLIVWDIIKFARSRDIPVGPGRGSAAGSLVAYALRITDLDPLVYTLLVRAVPESGTRAPFPISTWISAWTGGDEVINYVIDKYGKDHVAQIITFGTMGAKAAIRDVGRVLEIPYAEVDRIAKLVPIISTSRSIQALDQEPRCAIWSRTDTRVKELMGIARSLEGLARHASTHAAGVVISEGPLTDHVPLYKGANDEIVTQYSMGDVEKIGLVKFDFLGLKTLDDDQTRRESDQ